MATEPTPESQLKSDAWFLYTVKGEAGMWLTVTETPSNSSRVSFSLAEALRILQSRKKYISSDLILCLVCSAGAEQSLVTEFENFPPSLLSYLKSPGALSPGSSTVPEWNVPNGLSFVQNYIRVIEDSNRHSSIEIRKSKTLQKGETLYHLDSNEIYSWPLAVWSGGQLAKDDSSAKVPIIMVFGNWSTEDAALVHGHYNSGTRDRWSRLTAAPEWIFHDLNSIFGQWHRILGLSALVLRNRSLEISDESFTGNVLQRMRRLNRAMATNISVRECLLIQQNSIKEITSYGTEKWINFDSLEKDYAQTSFMGRCTQVEKSIAHDLLIVHGILEQLQNLMTMIISIEQISSGQYVARLGFLGFVFLPLSFVAGIFGMTTWSIEARWYPVAALPCLLITTVLAVLIPGVTSWWELRSSGRIPQTEHKTSPVRIFDDILLENGAELNRGRPSTREIPSNYALSSSNVVSGPGEILSDIHQIQTTAKRPRSFGGKRGLKAPSVRSSTKYHMRSDSQSERHVHVDRFLGIEETPRPANKQMLRRIWRQIWKFLKEFTFNSESSNAF